MSISRRWANTASFAAMLAISACATAPNAGPPRTSNTAPDAIGGGLGGYLLGDIGGGRNDRTARIVSAGIGGIASGEIGAYMDRQESELRARTDGTDVRVVRQGDDLILNIPAGNTFAYKSDTVVPSFQSTLDQVARVLGTYDRTYVDIYGHTDATGSDAYNKDLSKRRAVAVADYFASRGVKSARIGTRGFGKTQPLASNETAEGQAANRRVEIKIVPIAANDLR